jgi:hypothetical protein
MKANDWRAVGERLYEKLRKDAEKEADRIERTIAEVIQSTRTACPLSAIS